MSTQTRRALEARPRIVRDPGEAREESVPDLDTLLTALPTPSARGLAAEPIPVEDADIEPLGEDEEDATERFTYGDALAALALHPGVTDRADQTAGGYRLLKRLSGLDGVELWVAEKRAAFGPPRRAFLKRVRADRTGYPERRHRLLWEARIYSALHHPNVVTLSHASEEADGCHLVFESVEGTTLERVMKALAWRSEALPLELVAWIVAEAARGLQHVHEASDDGVTPIGIVAGELMPSNVVVTAGGQVKLASFGLRLMGPDDRRDLRGVSEEALPYLAPECILPGNWTERSDVFALGVLLFELLAGRARFVGAEDRVRGVSARRELPLSLLTKERVPAELLAIVERATAREPERRHASALELARDLTAWIYDSGRHAVPSLVSRFFERHALFRTAEHANLPHPVPVTLMPEPTVVDPTVVELAEPEPTARGPGPLGLRPEALRILDAMVDDASVTDVSADPPDITLSALVIAEKPDPDVIRVEPAVRGPVRVERVQREVVEVRRSAEPARAQGVVSSPGVRRPPSEDRAAVRPRPPSREVSAVASIRRQSRLQTLTAVLAFAAMAALGCALALAVGRGAPERPIAPTVELAAPR